MKEETIKNLHKIGNEEVRNLLEEEFPEAFEPKFDVEKYLKYLIEGVDQIDIDEYRVRFFIYRKLILDFRKKAKKYWMNRRHFEKIQQETGLDHQETRELCTTMLNTLTGWKGDTTYFFIQ